jgi:RNA polymerase sigma factor (sigma-70 family)
MPKNVKPAQAGIDDTPETPAEALLVQHAAGLKAYNQGLKAYNQLYDRYEKTFYTRATFTLKNHPASDDAIKTVLTKFWVTVHQRADSFEPRGEGSFERWANVILGNLCADQFRGKMPEVSINEEPAEVERASQAHFSASEIGDPLLKMQITKAMDTLPEAQRVVLCLKMIYQFTHEEIAQVLGIPEGTVKSRLNTACTRMRDFLQNNLKP